MVAHRIRPNHKPPSEEVRIMAVRQLPLPGEIVKKSNALCRASWSADAVWEARLIAIVASKVNQEDKEFYEYEIPISEIFKGHKGGTTYK